MCGSDCDRSIVVQWAEFGLFNFDTYFDKLNVGSVALQCQYSPMYDKVI